MSQPLSEGNSFCKRIGTQYPIIQGPMANITDNLEFAKIVNAEGALPTIALGNKNIVRCKEIIKSILENSPKKYAIGIIGFDKSLDQEYADLIIKNKPTAIIVAGAKSMHMSMFREYKDLLLLHTPNETQFRHLFDMGACGFIFEGTEAGGHIGELSLMCLIELLYSELEHINIHTPKSYTFIFAGGLNDTLSMTMLNAALIGLDEKDFVLGAQIGSAYLATKEALSMKIIDESYQTSILKHNETVTIGNAVNQPIRLIKNNISTQIKKKEYNIAFSEDEFNERYKKIISLKKEYNSNQGFYSIGEGVSTINKILSIKDLHHSLINLSTIHENFHPNKSYYSDNDFAIVGLGGIFPNANNVQDFWSNIINQKDCIRDIPEDRWNKYMYYDPDPLKDDKSYCKLGGFITNYKANPLKYCIVPKLADSIDKSQFMLLDAVDQALIDSGYNHRYYNKKKVGVFVGNSMAGELKDDYNTRIKAIELIHKLNETSEFEELGIQTKSVIIQKLTDFINSKYPKITTESCAGKISCIIAGRVTNVFDYKGGYVTVDTACASSLLAIDIAIKYLKNGEINMAVVGASDSLLNEQEYIGFCKAQTLSNKGSFPFDDRAGGFVQGEGAGAIIIKRLKDAIKDRDKIYSIIRSVGISSDGRGKGLTAPNKQGQIQSIKKCYNKVNIALNSIGMIETHGTSTQLGDSNEVSVINEVWSKEIKKGEKIPIGSVKSNIGHLKTAAGIASIIKASLALSQKILPPSINFVLPNKKIDFDLSCVYVNTKAKFFPWKKTPRRVAVNGFGFGGINAHVLLEEFSHTSIVPEVYLKAEKNYEQYEVYKPVIIGGSSLEQLLQKIKDIIEVAPFVNYEEFGEFIYNLNIDSSNKEYILALVILDYQDLCNKCNYFIASYNKNHSINKIEDDFQGIYFYRNERITPNQIGFVFPGQSSYYVNMSKDIINTYPFAEKTLELADIVFKEEQGESLFDLMFYENYDTDFKKKEIKEKLSSIDVVQSALISADLVYASILQQAGIKSFVNVGHSLGELSAMKQAGYITLQDVMKVYSTKENIDAYKCSEGKMIAVFSSVDKCKKILNQIDGYIDIANYNAYNQIVLSGDNSAIDEFVKYANEDGIKVSELPLKYAFHSKKMSIAAQKLRMFGDK